MAARIRVTFYKVPVCITCAQSRASPRQRLNSRRVYSVENFFQRYETFYYFAAYNHATSAARGGSMARQAVTADANAKRDTLAAVDHNGRILDVERSLGEIDLDHLAREVQQAGGHAVWWGVLAARAMGAAKRAKRTTKVTRAQRAKEIEGVMRRDPGARVTDKVIESAVETDHVVEKAEQDQIDAEEKADILAAVSRSVDEKQRTLRALTGSLARELDATHDGDPLRSAMRRELGRERSR